MHVRHFGKMAVHSGEGKFQACLLIDSPPVFFVYCLISSSSTRCCRNEAGLQDYTFIAP